MKKVFLALILIACGITGVAAETSSSGYDWTFFNLCVAGGQPETSDHTETYGLKVGLLGTGGYAGVYGIDTAVCYAGTNQVSGLQASLVSTGGDEVTGVQFSLVNFSVKVAGVQIGIVNFSKEEAFQIGILNFIEDSPVFCLPVINCYF